LLIGIIQENIKEKKFTPKVVNKVSFLPGYKQGQLLDPITRTVHTASDLMSPQSREETKPDLQMRKLFKESEAKD
jgi:hypothetical protein